MRAIQWPSTITLCKASGKRNDRAIMPIGHAITALKKTVEYMMDTYEETGSIDSGADGEEEEEEYDEDNDEKAAVAAFEWRKRADDYDEEEEEDEDEEDQDYDGDEEEDFSPFKEDPMEWPSKLKPTVKSTMAAAEAIEVALHKYANLTGKLARKRQSLGDDFQAMNLDSKASAIDHIGYNMQDVVDLLSSVSHCGEDTLDEVIQALEKVEDGIEDLAMME